VGADWVLMNLYYLHVIKHNEAQSDFFKRLDLMVQEEDKCRIMFEQCGTVYNLVGNQVVSRVLKCCPGVNVVDETLKADTTTVNGKAPC